MSSLYEYPHPSRTPSIRELARLADLALSIGDQQLAQDLIERIYTAYDQSPVYRAGENEPF
jgi:hypothetical protein